MAYHVRHRLLDDAVRGQVDVRWQWPSLPLPPDFHLDPGCRGFRCQPVDIGEAGLIRITSVAVPARSEVVLAKAVVVAALWTAAGAIISAAGAAAGAVRLALLPDDGPSGEFFSWDGTPVPW